MNVFNFCKYEIVGLEKEHRIIYWFYCFLGSCNVISMPGLVGEP